MRAAGRTGWGLAGAGGSARRFLRASPGTRAGLTIATFDADSLSGAGACAQAGAQSRSGGHAPADAPMVDARRRARRRDSSPRFGATKRWFVSLRPTRSAQALSVRAPVLLAHFVTWSLRQATAHAPTSGPPKEPYVRDPPRRSALPAPAPVGLEGAHSAGRDHPAGRARWWGQEHVGLLAGCALEPRPAHGQARARAS